MRRILERALFQSDAYNHLAAAVPRRQRIENLSAPIEDADPSRSTHLMSGEREEITAHFAHIDWHMPGALRRVHQCEGPYCPCFRAKFGDWINCAE